MGQSFLVDPNLLRKIADTAGLGRADTVVEIGSGPGTLTELLAERAGRVLSVELDGALMDAQREKLAGVAAVEFHHADFLEFDLREAARGGTIVVVGNIPYSITSPVIVKVLEAHDVVERALLLVQKEVADRLAAPVGGRDAGRLTVAAAYRARVKKLFPVGRRAFSPRPRVDSALVGFYFYAEPPVRASDEDLLFRLVAHLFRGRRKMIRSGLRAFPGLGREGAERVGETSGIPLTVRPEELSVDDWCKLCNSVEELL